jgi:non-heme chloroperoxidase
MIQRGVSVVLPSDSIAVPEEPSTAPGPREEGEAFEVRTPDGLSLSARIFGDPNHQEIVFIHGLGQSRLSSERQIRSSHLSSALLLMIFAAF